MKTKTIKIIYWILTILFCAFMLFSGTSHLMQNEQTKKLFMDLGYPLYLNTILGVAKLLGVVGVLQTKSRILKEWAYAGFTFVLLGASASFGLNGGGLVATVFPLIFLVVMFASYFLGKKIEQDK